MTKSEAVKEAIKQLDATGYNQFVFRRGQKYKAVSAIKDSPKGWKLAEMIAPGNVDNYRERVEPTGGFVKGDTSNTYWNNNDAAAQEQHVGKYAKAEPVFIDLTPRGCQTPEGRERVNRTMKTFDESREEISRVATQHYQMLKTLRAYIIDVRDIRESVSIDDFDELLESIEARLVAENEFAKAVCGR